MDLDEATMWMNQTRAHFDDSSISFTVFQDANGDLFVSEATYQMPLSADQIDATDEADKHMGLRPVSHWVMNFEDEGAS